MELKRVYNLFKKNDVLVIWREDENKYWLTNTYMLVMLTQEQFNWFKCKYSGLKNNPYIPDLEAGEIIRNNYGNLIDDGPDVSKLINDGNEKLEVTFTNTIFQAKLDEHIYFTDEFVGIVDNEYFKVFGQEYQFKTSGVRKPIFVYSQSNIIGALMPLDARRSQYMENINNIYEKGA